MGFVMEGLTQCVLILIAPITTATDDSLEYFFIVFLINNA